MKVKAVPVLDRRKRVRRDEDIWKRRHTDALENLLSDLAFEVRNLLIPIPAFTDLFRQEIDKIVEASTEERKEFKERWSSELKFLIDHAQRLIDRTRQIRLQTQPSPCAIQILVERVLEIWGPMGEEKRISIRCEGLESLPPLLAYEWRLLAVLSSMLGEAMRAVAPGGSVTISGRVDRAQEAAILDMEYTSTEAVELCETFDSGEILNPARLKFSVPWDHVGRIAETHGFRVSVESGKESGTKYSMSYQLT